MNYVAMLTFDDQTASAILQMRKDISKLCIAETAGTWAPHITLGVYDPSCLPQLISHARSVALSFHRIPFQFQVCGNFLHSDLYPDTDVFCLLPSLPLPLTELYRCFHEKNEEFLTGCGKDYQLLGNGQPTLHSTLAICDTSSYFPVSSYLYDHFRKIDALITEIQILSMEQELISKQKLL